MPFECLDSLYLYFINVFRRFLDEVAAPKLAGLDGTLLLRSYLQGWDDYAAFVGIL